MKCQLLIFLCCLSLNPFLHAEEEAWETFQGPRGPIVAKILDVNLSGVRLKLKDTDQEFTVHLERLHPADVKKVQDWDMANQDRKQRAANLAAEGPGPKPRKLYPMKPSDVLAQIEMIKDREADDGVDREAQKAVNELNVYRFLSGLPAIIKVSDDRNKGARRAARTFVEQGEKSREVDKLREHYLFVEGEEDLEQMIPYFLENGLRQHRATRPWRAEILNPGLKSTGFGAQEEENVCAMRIAPISYEGPEFWAYPGAGFQPSEYFHGRAWSYYRTRKFGEDHTPRVELYELSRVPEEPFAWEDPVPGKIMPVRYISVDQNAVHFEPERVRKKAVYWVRLEVSGHRNQYMVHFD